METLFERHLEYLSEVPTSFERELMKTIDWDSRLILIRGPKGVGKSTLMLQYILKNYGVSDRHVLYCSADTGYFTTHTLVDTAAAFVRQGGTHLFIDEIHKYDGWSKQIKEIYDLFKHLKVVLSGSSLIQLNDGEADLSRRQDIYDMLIHCKDLSFFENSICIMQMPPPSQHIATGRPADSKHKTLISYDFFLLFSFLQIMYIFKAF